MKRLLFTLFAVCAVFFSATAQTPGYAIFGDVPYGYTDLTANVVAAPQGSVTFSENVLTGSGLPGRINETSNYLRMSFNDAKSTSLSENFALHIVLKKKAGANNKVQVSLCNNGRNAARISWEIENSAISDESFTNIALNYSARNTGNWNSYGETNIVGDKTLAGEILRICAANGEQFEISQIYIKINENNPDPVAPVGDETAPENLTLNYSNVKDKSVTLTATATDENSPISYTFFYKADGDADFTAVAGAVNANSGADAVKEISGLNPETTYSFKVVATDPSSNSSEETISNITTLAAFKHRFYFFRAGDIPVIEGVTSVDLREGVGTSFQLNNMVKSSEPEYIHYALNGSWFSFNQNLSAATDMSIVSQSSWYLCIKMRTNVNQNSFNLRLNNAGECWMISSGNLPLSHDGSWETIALPLSTSLKTLTFTAAMTGTIFQMHANGSAASDYIDIAYAYLTDDPSMDEKPAIVDNVPPTNFSVTEKAGTTHNKATLQLYAEDEDTPITYTIHYTVKNSGVAPTEIIVNGAQGTTVEKEISGLTPETTYTFSVIASDPNGNETSAQEIEITTTTLVETRYYFFRGDPASVTLPSVGVISYDLREGVGSTVGNGGGFTHSQKKYYTAFVNGGGWWSFNQNLSSAKDMSEISQADWYLVVKFRTTISYGNFNIRLNNAVSYQNGSNLSYESDGSWNILTLALADAKNTLTYSASQSGTVFQFHADGGAGYLDIAYAYLTNNASIVDDFADNVVPVISSMSDGDKTTSSVVLTVSASDDSGEDITYIIKENDAVLTSTPATGASGAATAITVSELVGQDHTLTVIARDGAGNEASQNIAVTLPAAVAPPSNLVVTTTNTDKSVTFTMSADDDNASLVYAILDGSDNVLVDNIAGTAGGETVYTLHGLTPETAYSFKVRVTNAASLSTTSDAINITTDALSEHRFYLTRGNNTDPLPESSNLTSNYVDCNVEFGNAARDNRASDYISAKTGNTWIAITLKPKATVANEIDDNWYIVVRFRSNLSNNVFGFNNFRLNLANNAENWYINNSDSDKPFGRDYNDGNWIVIKKRIGDRRAGSAVPASYLQAGEVAAQLHVNANLIAGEFLDIDYIYFTDDVTNIDEGTQFNKRIALKDAEDNASVLSANNDQTVDIDLTRSLVNTSFNTLCLPFDLSAEQVANIFGAGTTIGQLTSARIKENDELYLNFSFVDAIEAGVPYIIQPENIVANPLIENVTIDNMLRPADFEDVDFKGVFNPTEIQVQSADSYTILLLGANNTLSWPNTTANMKGMRAYFDLSTQAANVVRRARFGFQQEGQATGIDEVQSSNEQTTKVLRNGELYIIRNGEEYTITGARVK